MNQNQAVPSSASTTPKTSAPVSLTAPAGMGRVAVRTICGSMSRSYHMLIAFAPPAVSIPPTSTTSEICKVASTSRPAPTCQSMRSWASTAQIAVTCSSRITPGFISANQAPNEPACS